MSTATCEPLRTILAFELAERDNKAEYYGMALRWEIGERAYGALEIPPRHLVTRGDPVIYRGPDRALWGQPGTVIGLCTTPGRCSVEMDSGQTLLFADEHELSVEVSAGRDAR